MTTSTTFQLHPDVRFRVVGGEAVVLRQDDAEALVLNGVGSRMLELLAEGKSRDQVLEELTVEFDVEHDEVARDLETFAQELVESSILRPQAVDGEP